MDTGPKLLTCETLTVTCDHVHSIADISLCLAFYAKMTWRSFNHSKDWAYNTLSCSLKIPLHEKCNEFSCPKVHQIILSILEEKDTISLWTQHQTGEKSEHFSWRGKISFLFMSLDRIMRPGLGQQQCNVNYFTEYYPDKVIMIMMMIVMIMMMIDDDRTTTGWPCARCSPGN